LKNTKRVLTVKKCFNEAKRESNYQVVKLEPGAGPIANLASQLTPGSTIYQQHVDLLRKRGWSVQMQVEVLQTGALNNTVTQP
jgi:hypothetical protein